MALHRLADFCLVSSLHDGMNLVAKEFVASRSDEDGVLVLSSFTGAARELTSALLINPFSADQMAAAIGRALTMPPGERRSRMRSLRDVVCENNIYSWAANIICTLLQQNSREYLSPRQTLLSIAAESRLCGGASKAECQIES
jgi:trehalose 6-phosphate synthase